MNSNDAYDYAWEHAARNPDGTRIQSSLVALVAEHVDFDVDKERRGHAQRIIARRKRPGQTAPEGSVVLPGMEPYAYEPHRLLEDDEDNVVENQAASVKFKAAEARRAQEAAQRALDRASREQNESGHFAVWAADQLAAGRPRHEVTWDACVRETGLWKDADPEPSDEDADPDEVTE